MKTFDEVVRIKDELAGSILGQPHVSGMDVSQRAAAGSKDKEYFIRIFVEDESITLTKLNLQAEYKEVPIQIIVRKFHLQ
jgi:hypothetical protein